MKESQHTEFKRQWKDDLLKWICAFANSNGGVLMLGYNDQGEAIGLAHIEKLLEDIPNKVRDVLGIVVEVNLVEHLPLHTLHIKTDGYPYPVSYKGEYHYRSGSTKQELKGAALDKFLMRKHGITWDSVPVPYVKADDFDDKTLRFFRQQSVRKQRLPDETLSTSTVELLEKLRLTQGDYLRRSAVMLFHPEPDYFVTGAEIKIGAFGKNHADLLHHDVIQGSLFNQVETALEVIQLKYLKASISYGDLYRKERFPLPIPALREALLNAVVHKDYGAHNAIQISIYPDKLMLWNPGQLPESWTLEKLLGKHESIPYNPEIAKCFFLAGLIEAWGRGIERIIEACKQDDYPTPEWKVEPNGVWVVFDFEPEQATQKTTQKTAQKSTREHILELLQHDGKMTRDDLAEATGVSANAIKQHLANLQKDHLLKREGGRKHGWWRVIR